MILAPKSKLLISFIWSARPHRYWGLERKNRNSENRAESEFGPYRNGGADGTFCGLFSRSKNEDFWGV